MTRKDPTWTIDVVSANGIITVRSERFGKRCNDACRDEGQEHEVNTRNDMEGNSGHHAEWDIDRNPESPKTLKRFGGGGADVQ